MWPKILICPRQETWIPNIIKTKLRLKDRIFNAAVSLVSVTSWTVISWRQEHLPAQASDCTHPDELTLLSAGLITPSLGWLNQMNTSGCRAAQVLSFTTPFISILLDLVPSDNILLARHTKWVGVIVQSEEASVWLTKVSNLLLTLTPLPNLLPSSAFLCYSFIALPVKGCCCCHSISSA